MQKGVEKWAVRIRKKSFRSLAGVVHVSLGGRKLLVLSFSGVSRKDCGGELTHVQYEETRRSWKWKERKHEGRAQMRRKQKPPKTRKHQ